MDENLLELISQQLVVLSSLSISDLEKELIRGAAHTALSGFQAVDLLKAFFLNKHRRSFPSLFLALADIWSQASFEDYAAALEVLDGHPNHIIPWVFYGGQYMGVDGLVVVLDSGHLSVETKTAVRERLRKGTPQPLARHLEELSTWGLDYNDVHQHMVLTGGPPIAVGHDYYRSAENR